MTRFRVDNRRDWVRKNPILADGEAGYERYTRLLKVGDGVSAWNDLPYFTTGSTTPVDGGGAVDSVNGHVGIVTLTKTDIGLDAVDNISDINKPLSSAQAAADTLVQAYAIQRANHTGTQAISTVTSLQTALNTKADLASPNLTGAPTAPTASQGTNTQQIATTAHVKAAIDALVAGAPGALDTLNEIATQLANDESAVSALTTVVSGKQASDADLTTIAALDSSVAGMLSTDGSGWIRKSYTQVKTALGLAKVDVGLGNVDNTADTAKPVSTAQAAADAAVQAYAIQRANHTGSQAVGTITGLAAVATSGAKADVGLGNVDNTADTAKPVSTAQLTALNGKASISFAWLALHDYVVGQIVVVAGQAWYCNTAHTSGASFLSTNWTLIQPGRIVATAPLSANFSCTTAFTDITGWQIVVPANSGPVTLEIPSMLVGIVTGTNAAGTTFTLQARIVDTAAPTLGIAFDEYKIYSSAATAQTWAQSLKLSKNIANQVTDKTYKVQAACTLVGTNSATGTIFTSASSFIDPDLNAVRQ